MTHAHHNLLGEPPATLLPGIPEADDALAAGADPAEVAAGHPTSSAAWGSARLRCTPHPARSRRRCRTWRRWTPVCC